MLEMMRKPRVGILLITTPRFRYLGEGTEDGVYYQRKLREADALVSRFSFAETVFPGIVYTREDIRKAIEAFTAADVDMVFAHFMSWSDDFAWIRFLRDMPSVPLFFAGIRRDELGFEDSLEENTFVEFLSAGGLVGMLEASGSAARFQRPMMYSVTGNMGEVLEEAQRFAKAACLRGILKHAVFGLLPSMNEVMWSTYVDPYAIFMHAGPELRFLSVAELMQEIAAVPKEAVDAAMGEILQTYPTHGDIREDKLFASVEASLAVESLARKYAVELLVLNDIDPVLLREVGLRPGFTPCPGTKDVVVVPEGDIGSGLACYVLGRLTGQTVNYIEPFHIDPSDGTFDAGHAGPNDYTDPGGKTLLSTDARFAKSDYKHAGAPFAWHVFSPGEKTLLHISQCNGTFKLVCSVVDCLESEPFLAGYSHGVFRSRIPAETFFTELQRIGVTQHYTITAGDHTRVLEFFSSIMNFDFYRI